MTTKSAEDYNALTCVQLRAICKERGLVQKGVKKVIIDRLMEDDIAAEASPAPVSAPVVEKVTKDNNSSTDEVEFQDETFTCKLFEGRSKYLTPSGLHFIANHQYCSGEYTHLDNLLNPFWTYLTECLPLWLAPNMVTTLGGLHCALAYGTLWYYSPDFDGNPPDWVLLLASYCTFAYYTLDCMDGKQARRTGSSSPLGQLL